MPLAQDPTTGTQPVKPSRLRPPPPPARPETAWSALGGGPRTVSGHYNPPVHAVTSNPNRGAELDALLLAQAAAKPAEQPDFAFNLLHPQVSSLADELGMKAGALTTVPEVEKYEPSEDVKAGRISSTQDTRSQILSEVAAEAREKGIKGRGMQAYMQEQLGHPGTEEYMQARLKPEETVEDQQERRDRTTRNALNSGGSRTKTDELTAEEYAKLNPRGKAAVDLNTLLVSAIREDMKGKKRNDADAGGKEYDAAVADIFGEEGAADATFAPTTMRVLHDIGFKAEGTNLDDVLKLKVGLTAEDIADISTKSRGSKDASLLTPEKVRDDLTESLVKAFRKQRLDPQRGSALLETQRDVLNTREALDFGGDANNQFIEQVYEFLANPANKGKIDQTMAMAKNTLSEEDWPKFLAFLDVRSREAQQYDRPLGLNGEVEYMRPRAFRNKLGL